MDMHQIKEITISAAHAAGKIIVEGQQKNFTVEVKGDPADRVTEVDKDAQQCIEDMLQKEFPEWEFLGEEDDLSMQQDFSRANEAKRSESKDQHAALEKNYRWIVDPLDGTSNFIAGLPGVGVSIALQENNEAIFGVLHFPFLQKTYWAIKDGGAFCDETQIHIEEIDSMEQAVITEIFSDRVNRGKAVTYPPCLAYRRFGSAVTSQALLAAGHIHGTALRCKLWDIAAGDLIMREAGAQTEWWLKDPKNPRSTVTIIAGTPKIFNDLKKYVLKEYDQ